MARIARIVVPNVPHHITQRGNRRQPTFFRDEDYLAYKELIAEWCKAYGVKVWAYCYMPNHTHHIAEPEDEEGLTGAFGEAHRRHTRMINFREDWRGHLWQGRFASYPMDEAYFYAAIRYVELNPVRAGLVARAEDYRWSSARAHMEGERDGLVVGAALLEKVGDWGAFLAKEVVAGDVRLLQRHERTGRPLGSEKFLARPGTQARPPLAASEARPQTPPELNMVSPELPYQTTKYYVPGIQD